MFLTRISVRHPIFAAMVMVALAVFGFYSYQRLGVEQFPDVSVPVVSVVVSYPGASAEAVEADVVKPIEDAVSSVSGIDSIQSTAATASAMVTIQFTLDVDPATAMQDVREKVSSIEASLPSNAGTPRYQRFDPSSMAVISLAIRSDSMEAVDLTALADDAVVDRLQNIAGVGSVSLVGGVYSQLDVLIDPDRLDAFGMNVGGVLDALSQSNVNVPAGSITQGNVSRTIQIDGRFGDVGDFNSIIVGRQGGQPVTLADVATITQGTGDESSLAFINGERAISVDIVKVQGANTVKVAEDVRTELQRIGRDLPSGVGIDIIRDNSVSVEQSLHTVENMILEGAVLAVLIVFLFLNSWRSTIITALTLPIALIGTMIALAAFGFTLNMMTLMALSLSVGILIDDAIVVRENITRHLHMGKSHLQAALDGTNEIGLAVLATTLSIVAVFLPVAFMEGILGQFFLQFGVTVSVAVLISLFVAFTLDPMLSSVWFDPAAQPGVKRGPVGRMVAQFDRFVEWCAGRYRALLRWCLRHRVATLSTAIGLFLGSFTLIPIVGAEFFPASDEGQFTVAVETPQGSSLDYTGTKVRQVEALMREIPEVTRTYATIGSGQTSSSNSGSVLVSLVDQSHRDRSPAEVGETARTLLQQLAGLKTVITVATGPGSNGKPIEVTVYGDGVATLRSISDELVQKFSEIPGLVDIESSMDANNPVIGIQVDSDLASEAGISLQQIGAALQPMLSGEEVGEWTAADDQTSKLVVRLPEEERNDAQSLADLPIGRNDTSVVRLGDVAHITEIVGPSEVNRLDRARGVTVDANMSGTTIGEAMQKVQAAIASLDLPTGYRVGSGGDAEQLNETASSAAAALLLAVVFIYLVLASQFGSFLQPIAIMMSLPLSLVGVLLGLLIGGSTINMMSMIGFIMLMGLVVKNAILLVDNANQHVKAGMNLFDALVEAGGTRFRPILMTTLAMVFGMMPLALGLHGATQNAPMAHAVIGGLISSTLLTLVVVPVMLTYTDAISLRVKSLFRRSIPPHEDGARAIPHSPAP